MIGFSVAVACPMVLILATYVPELSLLLPGLFGR